MVTLVNGNLVPMDLSSMADPHTNRTRTRKVDLRSDDYRVSRAYMIRLERSDLENPQMLEKLAAMAKVKPAQFAERYERAATRLVDGVPVET